MMISAGVPRNVRTSSCIGTPGKAAANSLRRHELISQKPTVSMPARAMPSAWQPMHENRSSARSTAASCGELRCDHGDFFGRLVPHELRSFWRDWYLSEQPPRYGRAVDVVFLRQFRLPSELTKRLPCESRE